ncbi:MAG: 1-acyl-sn-glycerol-3-phosphate acyltransferase [Bacteroidia bacterium]|nr:1-acyl-sn-glycerol-3-phosphate acyltransferase [Bacteroidia bacterium]
MIWHILKYLLSFSIPAFYRNIQIKNVHYLKNNHPAIISSNHPNAFMDPIAFSYMVYPPRVRYMARGDAFKPGLITKILQSIGIVPIFRMQDAGAEGVKKNNESYRIVYDLLKKNKKIMIFSEGICVQEKRLRPIKKGVPRLIFNAQQTIPDKEILIIPVCMNYSNPSEIGSTLFIHVGEPFSVRGKMNEFIQNPNAAMQKMMQEIYQRMLPLTIHIENPKNDAIFEKIRELIEHPLCLQKKLNPSNLEHLFIVEKEISECINIASKNQPEKFLLFSEKVSHLHDTIHSYDIHIPTIAEYTQPKWKLIFKAILYMIVFLLYKILYMIVGGFLYLPYFISHRLAKKASPSVEFYASFFLAFSTFIYLFYFLILFLLLKNFISAFWIVLFIVFSLSCIPLLHQYKVFRKKVMTLLKILNNKTFALNLSKNIDSILYDYEYFKSIIKA